MTTKPKRKADQFRPAPHQPKPPAKPVPKTPPKATAPQPPLPPQGSPRAAGPGGYRPPAANSAPPPAAATHDLGYSPDPNRAQAVVQQLQQLRATVADFGKMMRDYNVDTGQAGGAGDANGNGYLAEQQSPGTGQMPWPSQETVTPQNPTQQVTQGFAPIAPAPATVTTLAGQRQSGISAPIAQYGNPIIRPQTIGYSSGEQAVTPTTRAIQPTGGTAAQIGQANQAASQTSTQNVLSPDQLNAQAVLDQTLGQEGLGSLAGQVLGFLQQGYDATSIQYLLEQTPEYQRRFSGNAGRVKNGFAPLSPGEYLSTERAYQDVLRSSGLPSGFYDSPDDFAQYIGSDVSANELSSRVGDALKFAQSTDPTYRTALQAYLGIDTGHIAAYFLDPQRALPLLNKQAAAASIGAGALWQGLNLPDQTRAQQWVDQGVSEGQSRNAFQQIATILPQEQMIAAHFGQQYQQSDAEDELLGGLASAARKRYQLESQEQSLFQGSSGVGRYAFSQPDYGQY